MANLNSKANSVTDLVDDEPFETNNAEWISSAFVGFWNDKNIFNQHAIDAFDFIIGRHLGSERPLNLSQEIWLWIAVAPDISMEAGIVGLEELRVTLNPLAELNKGEAGLGRVTCQTWYRSYSFYRSSSWTIWLEWSCYNSWPYRLGHWTLTPRLCLDRGIEKIRHRSCQSTFSLAVWAPHNLVRLQSPFCSLVYSERRLKNCCYAQVLWSSNSEKWSYWVLESCICPPLRFISVHL